ncbi:hypothetical protein LptCag_0662 [Leptospirillum ferriphilum]|uniref:Uncharacterized protein n=2 Tax=Leptospirillum ferriphilum TaxID=178606 RepID=A0A094YLG7_9BACT|nr:hypothetical protein LFML04_2050 [Leptospirillum ferriphilum ML-04]KGA94036.1 hypothetical protein LptCag_0662 [Leptospirillum ferriphilum]
MHPCLSSGSFQLFCLFHEQPALSVKTRVPGGCSSSRKG